MKTKTFNNIIRLNKDFYEEICEDFSRTRRSSWNGWKKALRYIKEYIDDPTSISILDVACGNGRFYGYMKDRLDNVSYLGLDINDYLLDEAKERFSEAKFKKMDVILDLDKVQKKYDIVVAFGITHHIPSVEFRKKWFAQLSNLVCDGGLLIFTNWDFLGDSRIKNTVRNVNIRDIEINDKDTEQGDYFLSWGNKRNVYRYCHWYSDGEISEIIDSVDGFKLLGHFKADGRSGKLNKYYGLAHSF